MKRRDRPTDQSHLEFDLPLRPPEEGGEEEADLPLFPEAAPEGSQKTREPPAGGDGESAAAPAPSPPEPAGAEPEPSVTLGVRLLAALADLAVHGGVLVLAILGQGFLGLAPSGRQIPAFVLFLLAFSFLYYVVPMAFWGQTPGMASLSLVVRSPDGENLTFPQTALRWLAAVATLLLLGLPLLIAASGRSLGDRWSRSRTHRYPP